MSFGREYIKVLLVSALTALFLTGCGGGGGSDHSSSLDISGAAVKGPIRGATVTAYALVGGVKGKALGTAVTADDGSYVINVRNYRGDVIVESSGGSYQDEATGEETNAPPLRAALPEVQGDVTVALSPLTEIAVRLAGDTTLTEIGEANSQVSAMLGGIDIIKTLPADPTEDVAGKSQDQINYGLMLATFSQQVQDAAGSKTLDQTIEDLTLDLLDNQLDATGDALLDSLDNFLAGDRNNTDVSTGTSGGIRDQIDKVIKEPSKEPTDGQASDINKAKGMVKDLRNTILSIYNYNGMGEPGIIEAPFTNFSNELVNEIQPELTDTVDRIAWIIRSAGEVEPGATGTFTDGDLVLVINSTADQTEADFVIKEGDATIDSGSLTLSKDAEANPIAGALTATMKTATGQMEADLDFSATLENGLYKSVDLTGSLTAPGLSLDFSQEGRSLSIEFALRPESETEIYPALIHLGALIETTTVRLDGSLDIEGVWAQNGLVQDGSCIAAVRPAKGTFTGSLEALEDGSPAGVSFEGTIAGAWTNASTFDGCADIDTSNMPQWNGSFAGDIDATGRPTMTAFLKVSRNELEKLALDINYNSTQSDDTAITFSGNGNYDIEADTLSLTVTNQNGMTLDLSYKGVQSEDDQLSGTIKTAGGAQMAVVYLQEGVPMVKFIDNYFESIL